jgi:hypothetical protein
MHYESCHPLGRIVPAHSGQAFSRRAFLARSSVIFRMVCRAPTAELLRAALPLALTVQETQLVPLTAGRPGPLLGLAPLGTGRANFSASGSSKPSRSGGVRPYDPSSVARTVLGSVHHNRGRGV